MKIKIVKTVEEEIKYLKAKMGVHYWLDCEYSTDNGITWNGNFEYTDKESERIKKLTPCVVEENLGCGKHDYLELVIDIDEGKVLNWPEGFCLNTHYKSCDDGEYSFLDENMNEVVNITEEYEQYDVPSFFSIEDEGYGDYAHMNIKGNGTIEHFGLMKELITEYFVLHR